MARITEFLPAGTNKGLLVLALGTGLVAAIIVFVALGNAGGDDGGGTVAADFEAVVARQDIAVGTEITESMLELKAVPASLHIDGAFTRVEPIVGEAARLPIESGEQITPAKVGPQTDGDGLSFVVPKGLRAMSISVDEEHGVGGLLLPGDRVDVIAVDTDPTANSALLDIVGAATTILQNIEVMAVAQEAQAPVPTAGSEDAAADTPLDEGATSGKLPENNDPQPDARTITLAVTPEQAQLLAYAQETGDVYVTLRAFGEAEDVEIAPFIVPGSN